MAAAALAGLLALAGAMPAGAAAAQPPPEPAQDEFVPLGELEAREELPATPLVTIAYAAAWIILLIYLWSIWQRLGRVEGEMADLARRMRPGNAPGPPAGGEGRRP